MEGQKKRKDGDGAKVKACCSSAHGHQVSVFTVSEEGGRELQVEVKQLLSGMIQEKKTERKRGE